ncbi:MAG: anthranilate synthase component I [Caldilineales bacterium]|nr:anthranilate synthase component I [Caldilineales bacterium]MDW8317319.1 anthranilate synthase component I [Anaerolineae bacterium]
MYHPTLDQVRALAGQGNQIPIYRELPADLETPVTVYLKLRDGSPSFLLESVEKGEQMGRYSFIGVQAPLSLTARGSRVVIKSMAGVPLEERTAADPLDVVKQVLRQRQPIHVEGLPRFIGGAVGYLSYDWVRFVERLPATASDDLGLPDFVFLLADNLVIFDHVRHRLLVLANCRLNGDATTAYADAVARIDQIVARLRRPLALPDTPNVYSASAWQSNFTQQRFEAMVLEAKEHIAAGDIFQVVLSQRLSRTSEADPFTIYRALRMTNPSPYMYFLELPGDDAAGQPIHLIGSSPEMHVRLEEGRAQLHPIAGTRWRGASAEEDARLAAELLADPKERAEHVMLVDLGRNDLGRVCEYGSVHTPTLMAVERYSHVMHIVSDVVGRLRPEFDAFDLLRATFPAGTVSGAPKVRAMEIIEALEGTRRGPYAGCVGYIGYDGNMDTCITIRTIVMRGQTCHVQAGAGVVADSDPTYEWNETLNKARALAVAVELAERGLMG